MKPGRRWIHFDAQFPLEFGFALGERFGPVGELLFVHFLCACKRHHPQGEIRYRTDDEARALLGTTYDLVDGDGAPWSLEEFWTWLRYRRMVSVCRRDGRRVVSACRWRDWEMAGRSAQNAERKATSRAGKRPTSPGQVSEVPRTSVQEMRLDGDGDGDGDPPPTSSSLNGAASHAPTAPDGPTTGGRRPEEERTPRERGTNPRAKGTNPKARGVNPRALGTNPRARPKPPPDLLKRTIALVAEARLAAVEEAAAAGEREPIRSRSKWLATANEQLTVEIGDDLGRAWALTGAEDPAELAAALERLPALLAEVEMEATAQRLESERAMNGQRMSPSRIGDLKAAMPVAPPAMKGRKR